MGRHMSGLEESLGEGYQQIIMGMVIFIIGAAWGGMSAGSGMTAEDVLLANSIRY